MFSHSKLINIKFYTFKCNFRIIKINFEGLKTCFNFENDKGDFNHFRITSKHNLTVKRQILLVHPIERNQKIPEMEKHPSERYLNKWLMVSSPTNKLNSITLQFSKT